MIQAILPHLANFIAVNIVLDGDSDRPVSVPLNWPQALTVDDCPTFINQITGMTLGAQNSLYTVFNVAVRARLYYIPAGQDIDLKNQYDLYHYASAFLQALVNKPHLYIAGTGDLPTIDKAVTVNGAAIPTIMPYPVDDPQGTKYVGATFDLITPIKVVRC